MVEIRSAFYYSTTDVRGILKLLLEMEHEEKKKTLMNIQRDMKSENLRKFENLHENICLT